MTDWPACVQVSLSLNCMESARYYAAAADIIMVDPYPVGIDAEGCTEGYGCCGCDDCVGEMGDVRRRLVHVGQELLGADPNASALELTPAC